MIARLHSVAFHGIEAVPVEVEVDVARRGFAGTAVVGLPDATVKESIERVRSAMQNSGYQFPRYKTVVNLAPADLRKEGPIFDLPTAVGIIIANGDVVAEQTDNYLVAGELALDGRVRPIKGALSAAILAEARGFRVRPRPCRSVRPGASQAGPNHRRRRWLQAVGTGPAKHSSLRAAAPKQ